MKSNILFIIAISILIPPAGVFAKEDWEKKLEAEAWKNVTQTNVSDTTWYGKQKDRHGRIFEYIRYIHPNGRDLTHMNKTIGTTLKWAWELEKNGKICLVRIVPFFIKVCGKSIWKKENSYIVVSLIGTVMSKWGIKKGNMENFK